MPSGERKPIEQVLRDGQAVDAAFRRAVHRAVLEHKRAGNPVAIWKDGHVVWVPPEEIEVPADEE